MKYLKTFIILCLIIITIWVMVGDKELHKHFVLKNSGFELNIKDAEQQNSQSSTLFKIGEKLKTHNTTDKIREIEERNYAAREVQIIPSEILIAKMREQQALTGDNAVTDQVVINSENTDTQTTTTTRNYMNNMELMQQVVDMTGKDHLNEKDIQKALAEIESSKNTTSNRRSPNTSVAGLTSGNNNYEEQPSSGCTICDMFKNGGYKDDTIAWNIWRSNLQNRIMDDSNIDAEYGTIFFFSFKVDRNRNITNIRVTCTDKSDKYSVEAVREAIKNLNGKKILEFPSGTNRKIVDFTGGFLIGSYAQYSSPSDYNDYEHLRFRY